MPDRRHSVLMVLESTFPARGGGGAESQVLTLSRRLKALGIDVRLVVPLVPGGPQAERETVQGLDVLRLRYPKVRGLGGAVMLARLATLLWRERERYDVIHAHIAHNMATVCAIVGRLLGKPVMVKFTGPHEIVGGVLDARAGWPARVRRWGLRRASILHAISGRIRQLSLDCGFAPERILWLPNGVDVHHFRRVPPDPALRRRLCGHAAVVGVFAARLVKEKDHELLFHAWAEAFGAQDAGRAKLVLVGDGVLREPLQSLAESLGIREQVVFSGHADDVRPYLGIADFALLTSIGEGLSNSLLEYMAAGLAVIGSRVSGTEDFVVTGETGWLFDSGDRAALARALRSAAQAGPEALRRMGDEARRRIEARASVEAVTDELMRQYGFPAAAMTEAR